MISRKSSPARSRGRKILLKSDEEIALMRRAGRIVALTLSRLADAAAPGITTRELDRIAEATIRSFGALPSFYKLYGYPANICASVNDEVVHGIPSDRALQSGDIVSFDVGATVDGMIADGATTVGVGPISGDAEELPQATREALHRGLAQVRPGNRVADISAAVQRYVESHGYSVVRKLVGHGVGRDMHEPPHVPNFVDDRDAASPELLPGMTLAIEPMVNQGAWQVVQDDDGWTYRTSDGALSAHFEHTIAVTGEGYEILTLREGPAQTETPNQTTSRAGCSSRAPAGG
ncbi:MAG: type I methionyl aminopeptidase [Armatimonadetes bacterium]|nr:type I methionyl aminopeptidase [Armatimonadota bacterium]